MIPQALRAGRDYPTAVITLDNVSVCCPLAVTSPLLCSAVSSNSDLVVSVPRLL